MRYRRENHFDDYVTAASREWRIPPWLVKAVIATESSFNPAAHKDEPNLDPPDASRGLMQVLLKTARGLGYQGQPGHPRDLSGLYSPQLSIQLGTKLLRELVDRFPNEQWDGIYAAYNAGRPRRDEDGEFLNDEAVTRFRDQADYFRPGWRQLRAPGQLSPEEQAMAAAPFPEPPPPPRSPAGATGVSSPCLPSEPSSSSGAGNGGESMNQIVGPDGQGAQGQRVVVPGQVVPEYLACTEAIDDVNALEERMNGFARRGYTLNTVLRVWSIPRDDNNGVENYATFLWVRPTGAIYTPQVVGA